MGVLFLTEPPIPDPSGPLSSKKWASKLRSSKAELGSLKVELGNLKGKLGSSKVNLGTLKAKLGSLKSELGGWTLKCYFFLQKQVLPLSTA